MTAVGKDRGRRRGPTGISLDDPDGDGCCEEISEGDLDVAEWYLLNHPAPARGEITDEVARARSSSRASAATSCHVPDWHLLAHDPAARDYTRRYDGDRRILPLQVGYNDKTERLEGKLGYLAERKGNHWTPRRQAYTVRGIYSDFKYHDLGPAFYQTQFDGSRIKFWRTAPLWGVGSTRALRPRWRQPEPRRRCSSPRRRGAEIAPGIRGSGTAGPPPA